MKNTLLSTRINSNEGTIDINSNHLSIGSCTLNKAKSNQNFFGSNKERKFNTIDTGTLYKPNNYRLTIKEINQKEHDLEERRRSNYLFIIIIPFLFNYFF